MNLNQAKLVLSGGNARHPFFESVFDVSENEQPRCVIDLSAKTSRSIFEQAQKVWRWSLDKHNLPEPVWLQDDFDEPLGRDKTARLLDSADVLLVSGGSTKRAYQAWQTSNVAALLLNKVVNGDVVAAGGSTGAMIWFTKGYSDSKQFDVGDNDYWDYELVDSNNLIPAWVNVHHSDLDKFGRYRNKGFADTLRSRDGEWGSALGIDTNAALICRNGVARVKDLSSPELQGPHNVYLYHSPFNEPTVLKAGDAINLNIL
jgi:hypothetical protein